MKIHVTDRQGRAHILEGEPGRRLMDVLRDHNFVLGSCEGNALCGTCHVFVDPAWFDRLAPPGSDEIAQLDQTDSYREGLSRLSCQIVCAEALSGLSVTLASYGG